MKKIITLFTIALAFSAGAYAQTPDVKADQKVLKNTIKDKKEDKHAVGSDLTHLRVKSAVQHRKEVRSHRKSIHKQGRHLKKHGVKRPIEKAKLQAKEDKLKAKNNQ